VAHGSGAADRECVDDRSCLSVASGSGEYRLRRVWLDPEEERRYYYGFANEGLWPLCHRVHVRPVFRPADYVTYVQVNDRFAAAVCEEARGTTTPVVMVQDYHFALAPELIRSRLPGSTVLTFWHIPWPTPREFEICPWGREIVRGLLGSAIVGFHTAADCRQFVDTVRECLGGDADVEADGERWIVSAGGQVTAVGAYPISVEWPHRMASNAPSVDTCRSQVRAALGVPGDSQVIVGVDRLDYTKGLPEKVAAFGRLIERHRELRGRVTFVQVAEPSRECLPAYRALRRDLHDAIDALNSRFGDATWTPVLLREAHHDAADVWALLRAADVCFVGSLHDGMNLVAKEFVAARDDHRGVLVLSTFTGAARQLSAALQVNPYDVDASAEALAQALRIAPGEQARRMRQLRRVVAQTNSYWWASRMLEDAVTMSGRQQPVQRTA
jgi:trehalose 6-phosphate synthase